MRFDVFNGDADGLCALQQLRLAAPADAQLITGAKRDIALLARADLDQAAPGDVVTVLDVSLDRNRTALEALLARGARITWFDHHFAGAIPVHPQLEAHIDTAPQVCTSILVDRHLDGRYRAWAIAAAFGDGLVDAAYALAATRSLAEADIAQLRELGEALNYNGYGETEADLTIHPAALYALMRGATDPLRFAAEAAIVHTLSTAKRADLEAAGALAPVHADAHTAVFVLPDAAWSRRVNGSFAHALASATAQRAHAVLTPNAKGGYVVSVRAPRARPQGADVFCRGFGGGGRSGAAGIDHLPAAARDAFVARFAAAPWTQ
jgi:hypothetical protein